MLTKDRNILGLAFYGLILPVIGSLTAHELFHDVKFTHYNVHAIIELSGASLAILIVAALLLNNYSEQKDSLNHNIIIIIGCALLSMAVFDIFHAISPVGNNFVWLHSLATFFGGLFFASVILLKYLPPDFRLNRSLLHITTTFSLAVSIFTVLSIISSPIMILDDDFTILSKSLNIIGGCGFIVASLFFYKTFREKKDNSFYLLSAHCLLFGSAGILFELSSLWDLAWWWWHILRLAAYFILLLFYLSLMKKSFIKTNNEGDSFPTRLILSLIVLILSVVVMFGWFTNNHNIIQISKNFAPMQFNTALCFFLLACSIVIIKRSIIFSKISAFLVFLISLMTLIEYMYGIDFGIDNLIIDASFIEMKVLFSGRMSFITAMSFLMLSLSILIPGKLSNISFVLASLTLIFSLLAFFTYISDPTDKYMFLGLKYVAIHTSLSFIALSSAFIIFMVKNNNKTIDIWNIVIFITFLILSSLTIFAWLISKEYTNSKNLEYISKIIDEKHDLLTNRFTIYEQALRNAKGFIKASEYISKEEWRNYVHNIEVEKYLKGSNGVGFIDYVKAENLDEYQNNIIESEDQDFKVRPKTDFEDKFVIKYIEPENINGPAVGLDIGFENNRRKAAEKARDQAVMTLTDRIILVQDKQEKSGFLLLLPVYKADIDQLDTVAKRRENFLGWAYSPFMARKFMRELFLMNNREVVFSVYGDEKKNESLKIYQVEEHDINQEFKDIKIQTKLSLADKEWILVWQPGVNFKPKASKELSLIILISGIIITLLITGLFYLLSKIYGASAREMEHNRQILKNIFDNAVEGIITINKFGIIENYNKACENLFGYKKDEVIGQNIKKLMPKKYSTNHDQYINKYVETGEKKIIGIGREVEGKRKDGTHFPLELSVTEIKVEDELIFTGIIRDLTERKKAEEEIQKSQNLLNLFIENTPAAVAMFDNDMKYLNCSRRWIIDYGIEDKNSIIGQSHYEIFPEITEKHPEWIEIHKEVLQGKIYEREEDFFIRSNGEKEYIRYSLYPWFDNEGEIGGLIMFTELITRQVKDRIEKEKLIERLTDSNEELERFAYICSHDLQEPLRMISSFSEKLQDHISDKIEGDSKAEKYFSFVIDGAVRSQKLIKDILAYSRVDSDTQKLDNIDVSEHIDKIIKNLGKQGDYEFSFDKSRLPIIRGNSTQIYQLLQNLINNALKYQDGSKKPKIDISCQEIENFWQFKISDNGIGIKEAHLNEIFDVFRRLHRKDEYQGTGIGLSICRKIIKRHGGRIWAESELGKGTDFYFTIKK